MRSRTRSGFGATGVALAAAGLETRVFVPIALEMGALERVARASGLASVAGRAELPDQTWVVVSGACTGGSTRAGRMGMVATAGVVRAAGAAAARALGS